MNLRVFGEGEKAYLPYDSKYLEVDSFSFLYNFHPESISAKEVWERLPLERQQAIVSAYESEQGGY